VGRSGPIHQFELSGGALCLDFANTLGDRPREVEEHLHDWRDLVSWAEQAGLMSKRDAAGLRRMDPAPPAEARAFARALELREHLYRLFSAIAAERSPDHRDLDALNAALGEALREARVESSGSGFVWSWAEAGPAVARILRPVVRSAADLLVSPDRPDVRECASETCSWLFVDRSRTHRRRWCSMKTCGNRDKARRFYQRKHA
jgi:predicted RNA-binding Zn ribbon-like protein